MLDFIKTKLPESINELLPYRSKHLYDLLQILQTKDKVLGILLGGSLAYKNKIIKSDIDLFCLIDEVKLFEENIEENISPLQDIDEIIFQGHFPWTEKLYTIYFKQDLDFSIDLCLINYTKSETFFWEPDGYILFDKEQTIERCRTNQIKSSYFTRQPFLKSNPFSLSVVTLKKIEKNLYRNHLWNALEQLNSLRRYVMQIIRLEVIKDSYFLGRVDRDIEDIVPFEINNSLSKTVANYDTKDIAQKTILLINMLINLKEQLDISNEKNLSEWVFKQLKHESKKFNTYL